MAKPPYKTNAYKQAHDYTAASRVQRAYAKASDLDFEMPDSKLIKKREKYRFNLRLFCDEVLTPWFPLPHSEDQLFCLNELQTIAIEGGSRAIARSRGTGKSQHTKGTALWAALFRHRRYTVPFAATAKFAKKNLNSMIKMLATSEKLRRLWPEIAIPIRVAYGKPNRSKYLTRKGEPLHLECSTSRLVFPHYEELKEGVSVIECSGILEASRGLQFDTPTGETLRPDFLIGDDFQTKASAKSPEQCTTRIETIAGDFAQMGGPDVSVAMVLNCTVIETNDAADQLLDRKKHPALHGIRQQFVYDWPVASRPGMDSRKIVYNSVKDLWEKYIQLRKQGMRDGDNGKAATEFYVNNRTTMDEGSKVGWEHKYVKKSGEHSAIQHAWNIIADYGEKVFAAEYQNRPMEVESVKVKLTVDQIINRCNGLAQGEVPPLSCIVTAFIDPNDHALAWGIGAFTKEMAGAIVAYGEWGMNGNGVIGQTDREDRIWDEKNPPKGKKENRFWEALDKLSAYIFSDGLLTMQGRNVQVNALMIDSGYKVLRGSQMVYNWCESMTSRRFSVFPSTSWSAGNFPKPVTDKTMFDSFLFGRKDFWSMRKYTLPNGVELATIHHDVDYHRREVQIGWSLPLDSPGSISVWGRPGSGPGTDGMKHLTFAKQNASRQLITYSNENDRYSGMYRWVETPGVRKEGLDVVVGCRVCAMALAYSHRIITGTEVSRPTATATPGSGPAPAPTTPKPPATVQQGVRVSPGWSRTGGF